MGRQRSVNRSAAPGPASSRPSTGLSLAQSGRSSQWRSGAPNIPAGPSGKAAEAAERERDLARRPRRPKMNRPHEQTANCSLFHRVRGRVGARGRPHPDPAEQPPPAAARRPSREPSGTVQPGAAKGGGQGRSKRPRFRRREGAGAALPGKPPLSRGPRVLPGDRGPPGRPDGARPLLPGGDRPGGKRSRRRRSRASLGPAASFSTIWPSLPATSTGPRSSRPGSWPATTR